MSSSETVVRTRYLVTGRVQGVFFRKSTRDKALELGLDGWVRNLPGGEVELAAAGSAAQHEALERWLWEGPERAEVDSVTRTPYTGTLAPGFSIV